MSSSPDGGAVQSVQSSSAERGATACAGRMCADERRGQTMCHWMTKHLSIDIDTMVVEWCRSAKQVVSVGVQLMLFGKSSVLGIRRTLFTYKD